MRVHHLNCGSHCPLGGAFFDGASKGLLGDIRTHCLLIETNAGLVLVDAGYGLNDVRHPHPRLPHTWRALLNIRLREGETAIRQVERLGFSAGDVRHIVLTHLDFDHAGGLDDFPEARAHILSAEIEAAETMRRGFVANQRYRPRQWGDRTNWKTYDAAGEKWFGFDAVRALDGLPPEILMIPLRGHTLGHAGVAVHSERGWLLHAGDAYLHRDQMQERPGMPPGLAIYQHIMDSDRSARRANQQRLRELKSEQSGVTVFCSHDTEELAELLHLSLGRGEGGGALNSR